MKLFLEIVHDNDNRGIVQYDIVLLTVQHLRWNAKHTADFFQWALKNDNLPSNFFNQYFFYRLCGCGNRKSSQDMEHQKHCQMDFVNHILRAQRWFFNSHYDDEIKVRKLGELLHEATEMLNWTSFACIDEEDMELLCQEIEKLRNPPKAGQVLIVPEGGTPPNYMSQDYPAPLAA
ncbi:MAG: hypothetical protein F4X92_01945 [Gammaproteobacteria bacterium]|nr:hypothetical protein [Gammaproteobacteria bacterium]